MNCVLGLLKNQCSVVYFYDILVVSATEEQWRYLDEVLHKLSEAGFRLIQENCQFSLSKISYLGHTIYPNGMLPLPEHIAAVAECPTPEKSSVVYVYDFVLTQIYSQLRIDRRSPE